jgi:hypothetical protein
MNRGNFADKRCAEGISDMLKEQKWRYGSFVFRMKENLERNFVAICLSPTKCLLCTTCHGKRNPADFYMNKTES